MFRSSLMGAQTALLVVGLLFGVAAAPQMVHAQAAAATGTLEEQQARAHFQLGKTLYDGGSFEQAAHEFEEAFRLSQRPQLLYNIFLAWRDASQMGKAIDALQRYLTAIPNAPDAASLRSRLTSMQRAYSEQQQREQEATAATERARAEAARAEAARAEQQRQQAQQNQQAQQQPAETHTTQATTTTPATNTDTSSHASSGSTRRGPGIAPWIVIGGGAVILAGSLVTGLMSAHQKSVLDQNCPAPTFECNPNFDLAGTRAQGRTFGLISDITLGVGLAAVGAGVIWLVLGKGSESPPPATASFMCTGSGCAASARFEF